MELSDNIKALLCKLDMKPSELADKSGVAQPRIHEIVNGITKNPRIQTLKRISEALGVTVDVLTSQTDTAYDALPTSCIADKKHSPYIDKIISMLEDMDENTQADICLSVEKEKLLRELIQERQERKAA